LIQFCWAHLIRDIRFLAEHTDKSLRLWGHELLEWVRQLFTTWHRAAQMTAAGFTRSMDRLRREFLQAVRRPPWRAEAQTLAGSLPANLIQNARNPCVSSHQAVFLVICRPE
jgi:hypothetical protein